jgi:DNA transposition AAA+ family ATPase
MRSKTAKTKNIIAAFDAYQNIATAAEEGTPAIGLFSGEQGLGKTTAGAWLFSHADGILVRCLKADSLGTFLERLAADLGLEYRQRRADMLNYIVKELALTNKPVFIDEADYIADKIQVLETIRDIYDLANVPIILIGYEQLPKKVKRLPQLHSRISQHVEFKKADFEDIETMASELVEKCEIAEDLLRHLLTKADGNFRRIHVGLGNIEKFCLSNSLQNIELSQWANRPLFPSVEL